MTETKRISMEQNEKPEIKQPWAEFLAAELEVSREGLLAPIPNMDQQREHKNDYRDNPPEMDLTDARRYDDIVEIKEFGLKGEAYAAKKTKLGGPFPEAKDGCYLNITVAMILAKINEVLSNPKIIEQFGGRELELFITDGMRTQQLQKRLHDQAWPDLIRTENPDWTEEQVMERADQVIAGYDGPHTTGGAFDVMLRYKDTGIFIDICKPKNKSDPKIQPDYFEINEPETGEELVAQLNRRIFYNIMTGKAFGMDTGLAVHPFEVWHYGIGDALSASQRGEKTVFPSVADFS